MSNQMTNFIYKRDNLNKQDKQNPIKNSVPYTIHFTIMRDSSGSKGVSIICAILKRLAKSGITSLSKILKS